MRPTGRRRKAPNRRDRRLAGEDWHGQPVAVCRISAGSSAARSGRKCEARHPQPPRPLRVPSTEGLEITITLSAIALETEGPQVGRLIRSAFGYRNLVIDLKPSIIVRARAAQATAIAIALEDLKPLGWCEAGSSLTLGLEFAPGARRAPQVPLVSLDAGGGVVAAAASPLQPSGKSGRQRHPRPGRQSGRHAPSVAAASERRGFERRLRRAHRQQRRPE